MIKIHQSFFINRFKAAIIYCILLLFQASISHASLNIEQLPQDLQKKILTQFPQIKENTETSLKLVDDVVHYLHLIGDFDEIRAEESENGQLTIQFQLTKKIGKVEFVGSDEISDGDLKRTIGLDLKSSFNEEILIEAGEKIKNAYRDKGFLKSVIDVEVSEMTDANLYLIRFKISEGEPTRIQDFKIESPNVKLNDQIYRLIKSHTKKNLTDERLRDIAKEIREELKMNKYIRTELIGPELQFAQNEATAIVKFKLDKPENYLLDFQNNISETDSKLHEYLNLENFYSANPDIGPELAAKLKQYYLSKGYARVDIKVSEVATKTDFQQKIVFDINEGPIVRIEKIEVTGNIQFPNDEMATFIKEHSSDTIARGYYFKDDLDIGFKNLILDLQNRGFLQAKINSSRMQFNKEKNKISIILNIDQGPLTIVKAVHFTGNNEITSQQLESIAQVRTGALSLQSIDVSIEKIKQYYRDNGYIEMILLNEKSDLVSYSADNTEANIEFKIFEGPQVKVAHKIIEGNTFTKDYVIYNEVAIDDNEILTPNKIESALNRLQKTGYFSSVEIKTLEEKTIVADRTLLIKVKERDPGVFMMGAGATNERNLTIRGYTGIAYRNLWGTGRGVSLRTEGNFNAFKSNYFEHKTVLGYIEPYLFNTRTRGRINLTRQTSISDYTSGQATDVNQTTYSIEREFTPHITGIWEIWSLATLRDYGIDSNYHHDESLLDIATTGPTVDIDFRDNPFNPTSGSFTRLNLEYSTPQIGSSSTINYYKSTASYTHYTMLKKYPENALVWANQLRLGFLKNLSETGGVPYDKKGFILGGRSTVRGFENGTNEVFPNQYDLGTDKYTLTTSAKSMLIKSELRFPIMGSLGGAIFYDGGSVDIEGLSVTDNYRDSSGVAIRYNTPFGPLNLEWGCKLDRKPDESPCRFHLSIGTY